MIADAISMTVAEKCAACGVTEKTLRNWWALGCPKEADVDDTLAWRDARFGKKEPKAESGDDLRERKLLAEAIKIEHEGAIKELERRTKAGELIPRAAVERFLASWVSAERAEMESWADAFVTEMPGEVRQVVHDLVTQKVRLKLRRLAEMPTELWNEEEIREASQ